MKLKEFGKTWSYIKVLSQNSTKGTEEKQEIFLSIYQSASKDQTLGPPDSEVRALTTDHDVLHNLFQFICRTSRHLYRISASNFKCKII
jgi:hypothetical protein